MIKLNLQCLDDRCKSDEIIFYKESLIVQKYTILLRLQILLRDNVAAGWFLGLCPPRVNLSLL